MSTRGFISVWALETALKREINQLVQAQLDLFREHPEVELFATTLREKKEQDPTQVIECTAEFLSNLWPAISMNGGVGELEMVLEVLDRFVKTKAEWGLPEPDQL